MKQLVDWTSHFLSRILRHGAARNPANAPRKTVNKAAEAQGAEAWGVAFIEPRSAPKWKPQEWTYLDTGGWAQYNDLFKVITDVYPEIVQACLRCHDHDDARGKRRHDYILAREV